MIQESTEFLKALAQSRHPASALGGRYAVPGGVAGVLILGLFTSDSA